VRCPNYLGEIMVWTGSLIAAAAFLTSPLRIVLALVGWVCIVLIMMGSTKRLEHAQDKRYGERPAYQEYVRTVPVLFPWVPVYSLKGVRVYLE
jgi:steroid 5-alpha reductase family enzyme